MVRFGAFKLTDDVVESSHIKDGEIVNADVNAAAAIVYSKLATDPRICLIKTGTYTGDDNRDQPITGIGFQPKALIILRHVTSATSGVGNALRLADTFDNIAISGLFRDFAADKINSLDADGFSVDDGGTDGDPNTNGQQYDYVAFG